MPKTAARKNPVADVIQWWIQHNPKIITVEHVDVDDARKRAGKLRAPGHVLRLAPGEKGPFEFLPATFEKRPRGWKDIDPKMKSNVQGTFNLKQKKFSPWKPFAKKLDRETLKCLTHLFQWVHHEWKEHGKFPPPRSGAIRGHGGAKKAASARKNPSRARKPLMGRAALIAGSGQG